LNDVDVTTMATGARIVQVMQHAFRDPEMLSASIVAGASGLIALAVYLAINEHELKQFYTRHSKACLAAYIICMAIVWFSFVNHGRFVLTRLFSAFVGPISLLGMRVT
jgi:hypothetical protein